MLLSEPLVGFTSLYTAFTFAVLFAFFAAFPHVFGRVYNFEPYQIGLTFIAVGVGVILGVVTSVLIDRLVYVQKHRKVISEGKRQAEPEHRLYGAMVGSLGIPIGLFWLGWAARKDVHWIVPVLGSVPFAWGNLSVFVSSPSQTYEGHEILTLNTIDCDLFVSD
jgi:hypothetical protein